MEYGYSSYGKMVTMKTYRSGTSWNASSWPGGAESPDTTTWQYDAASGQMTNKVYADSSNVGYTYTSDGKLSTRTWARSSGGSHVTTYSYDSDTGELTGIDYSDSTPDITFTYNRMGQQVAVIDAVGGRGFAYNSAFQLESETITNTLSGLTHTLTRSYSDTGYLGRDAGFDLDSDYSVQYDFDSYGRMNSVTHSNFASFAPFVVNYSYLSNSDLISVVSNSYGLASTRSYESDRNLITEVLNEFGTNIISRYAYGNDQLARRTNRIDTGSAISAGATNVFGYNDRSELTSALMTTNGYAYSYDPIGNRESATNNADGTLSYTANELNQYTEITNGSLRSLFHDPDGNLTNDGDWAYSWDGENHLISVESLNLTNGANKVESDFDYKGRRIRKTVSVYTNSAWTVVSTNHFMWDQWNPIREISFSGGTTNTRSFAYGLDISGTLDGAGGIGGLLSMTQGTNVYFYCADGNGNVVQLVDGAGATVAEYEYSPFGEIKTSAGTMATDNPFRFSSKYYDDEITLLIYELRPVRPKMLGRFLSRDPIEEKGGLNVYALTGNRTVNSVDSHGLSGSEFEVMFTKKAHSYTGVLISFLVGDDAIGKKGACRCKKPKLAQIGITYEHGLVRRMFHWANWKLDANKGSPFYPYQNSAGAYQVTMTDAPGPHWNPSTLVNGVSQSFETCAICTDEGKGKYWIIGCCSWGHTVAGIGRSQRYGGGRQTPISPSAEFIRLFPEGYLAK